MEKKILRYKDMTLRAFIGSERSRRVEPVFCSTLNGVPGFSRTFPWRGLPMTVNTTVPQKFCLVCPFWSTNEDTMPLSLHYSTKAEYCNTVGIASWATHCILWVYQYFDNVFWVLTWNQSFSLGFPLGVFSQKEFAQYQNAWQKCLPVDHIPY